MTQVTPRERRARNVSLDLDSLEFASARTFVDDVADADDLFAWSSSNPFGSCLADLAGSDRCRVRERVARKLEALGAPDRKIRLERYLLFATAHKA